MFSSLSNFIDREKSLDTISKQQAILKHTLGKTKNKLLQVVAKAKRDFDKREQQLVIALENLRLQRSLSKKKLNDFNNSHLENLETIERIVEKSSPHKRMSCVEISETSAMLDKCISELKGSVPKIEFISDNSILTALRFGYFKCDQEYVCDFLFVSLSFKIIFYFNHRKKQ